MSTLIHKDAKLWVAEFELTGDLNEMAVTHGAEAQDATVFGKATRIQTSGLETLSFDHAGYAQFGSVPDLVDKVLFDKIGADVIPMTVAPTTGVAGQPAIFFEGKLNSYVLGGAVGILLPFRVGGVAAGGRKIINNGLLLEDGVTAKTATGTGTGRQFVGGVASGKSLYAIFHLLTFTGAASIDVLIESDDTSGFTTPVTRVAFSNKTAPGSQYAVPIAGPLTDDWYRAKYTFNTPTTPSAKIVVAMGIK